MTKLETYLTNLEYPISKVKFNSDNKLFIVGGGGSSRSGVKNKLNLYQITEDLNVDLIAECNLIVGEDAPTSFDFNSKNEVFTCGINGTPQAILEGKNESLKFGKLEKEGLKIIQSKKISENSKSEDYQKVTLFNKEGDLVFVASAEGQVNLLKYPSLKPKVQPKQCVNEEICDGDLDSESRYFVTASDKAIHFFNTEDGNMEHSIDAPSTFTKSPCKFRGFKFGRGISEKCFFMAINSKDRKKSFLAKFAIDDFEKLLVKNIAAKPIESLNISENGKYLAVATADQSVHICDTKNLRILATFKKAHSFAITTLDFSPDGKYLVSGSADATVRVYRLPENLGYINTTKYILLLTLAMLIFLTFIVIMFEYYSKQVLLNNIDDKDEL